MIAFHTDWYCPNCGITDQTVNMPNRFHNCAKLGGLTSPLFRVGTKAKVEAVMRDDYVGTDIVQKDDQGRIVMALKTTRDDGTDVVVFAPTATAKVG